jgi:hypothetical protein
LPDGDGTLNLRRAAHVAKEEQTGGKMAADGDEGGSVALVELSLSVGPN